MNPEMAAILWTLLLLLWIRPGVFGGIIAAIIFFEVFYLLSSLPVEVLQKLPFLRPSSAPFSVLALVLLIFTVAYRLRHIRRHSSYDRDA